MLKDVERMLKTHPSVSKWGYSWQLMLQTCFDTNPWAVFVGPSRKLHLCWTVDTPAVWPPKTEWLMMAYCQKYLEMTLQCQMNDSHSMWLVCDMVNGCGWDELSMHSQPDHSRSIWNDHERRRSVGHEAETTAWEVFQALLHEGHPISMVQCP